MKYLSLEKKEERVFFFFFLIFYLLMHRHVFIIYLSVCLSD